MTGIVRPEPPAGTPPPELVHLVGRRAEVEQVRRLLSRARLVTLTGVGGCGKTRLGLRVAQEMRAALPDGVWLADLALLTDEALLEHHVAQALKIQDQVGRGLPEMLLDHLRPRTLLLVLDNCEHLVDACARLVHGALRAAGGLRVLCTSRQPLGIVGERIFMVPPLPVPDNEPLTADPPGRYAALMLFVERAAEVVPGFAMTAENRRAIAHICWRLDGLPLAIELAAAQVGTFPLEAIEAQLRDRSELLSGDAALGRHRTLTATFDWSFESCSPAEQVLWARIAAFAGSFEAAAVQQVCGGDGLPADEVADALAGLVDKSVLIAEPDGDELCYRLLETVRQYGLDRLRAFGAGPGVDEALLRSRHRDYYLELAERFDADWFGPRQRQWTRRMRAEHANLRAALSYCLASPDRARAAVRLAGALTYFWWGCGAAAEGQYWLERALAGDPRPSRYRLRTLIAYGRLLIVRGEHAAATAWLTQCLEQAKQLNEPSFVARALNNLGARLALGVEPAKARPVLQEAVDRFEELGGSDPEVTFAKIALVLPLILGGEPDRAADLLAECRALCHAHGDRWWLGHVLTASAHAAMALGDLAQAGAYVRQALQVRRDLDDPLGVAAALERLAWLAVMDHECARAARLLGAADRQWRVIGQRMYGGAQWRRDHDECENRARRALGETQFNTWFHRGARLPLAEAVADALNG